MDFNFLLFPAPKREPNRLLLEDHLIFVPVYSDACYSLHKRTAGRLQEYFRAEDDLSGPEQEETCARRAKIAEKISLRKQEPTFDACKSPAELSVHTPAAGNSIGPRAAFQKVLEHKGGLTRSLVGDLSQTPRRSLDLSAQLARLRVSPPKIPWIPYSESLLTQKQDTNPPNKYIIKPQSKPGASRKGDSSLHIRTMIVTDRHLNGSGSHQANLPRFGMPSPNKAAASKPSSQHHCSNVRVIKRKLMSPFGPEQVQKEPNCEPRPEHKSLHQVFESDAKRAEDLEAERRHGGPGLRGVIAEVAGLQPEARSARGVVQREELAAGQLGVSRGDQRR